MVFEIKEFATRDFRVGDGIFDLNSIYKGVKEKAESMGYKYFENEQSLKSTQYGEEIIFKILIRKQFDDFGMADMDIEFMFVNMKKIKNHYKGDLKLSIRPVVKLDWKHKWGRNAFSLFLLNLYRVVFLDNMKKNYIIPVIKDSWEIYDHVKELVDEYKH